MPKKTSCHSPNHGHINISVIIILSSIKVSFAMIHRHSQCCDYIDLQRGGVSLSSVLLTYTSEVSGLQCVKGIECSVWGIPCMGLMYSCQLLSSVYSCGNSLITCCCGNSLTACSCGNSSLTCCCGNSSTACSCSNSSITCCCGNSSTGCSWFLQSHLRLQLGNVIP